MFIVWLVSIILYWSNAPFLGLVCLFAGGVYGVFKSRSFNKTDVSTFVLTIGILSLSWYYGFYLYANSESLLTYLHALVLACFLFFLKPKLDYKILHRFSFYFSLVSTLFIGLGKIFFEDFFYYTTVTGVKRYEFVFSEPSFLGIFCSLLLFLLLRRRLINKTQVATILFLIINVLFTASGAGIALLVAVFLLRLNLNFSNVFKLSLGLVFSVYMLVVTTSIPDLVYSRFERVVSGDYDTSTKIRFVAPMLIASETLNNSPLLGVGLGNADYFIRKDYSNFDYLLKKDSGGKYFINTNIDNVWINVLFLSGLFGLFGFVFVFIYRVVKGALDIKTLLFFSFAFFFCGAFIHPLFFGVLNFRYKDDE